MTRADSHEMDWRTCCLLASTQSLLEWERECVAAMEEQAQKLAIVRTVLAERQKEKET